ncbi:hypothetical protein I7I51_07642 [Histoplasma capsulatum]|uniref:C2H2-type domain-containing protein n=1 Tax=Ajellomyces capsulatus TaxID=5037 RepID=A0A8A1LWC3_AJECA|nr:hypothetical protein I7I51_07642 [Histoplasma capsulatum]
MQNSNKFKQALSERNTELEEENRRLKEQLQVLNFGKLCCPRCPRRFKRPDRLYLHIRQGHRDWAKLFSDKSRCDECDKSVHFYLRHLRGHHKDKYRATLSSLFNIDIPYDATVPSPPHCFDISFINLYCRLQAPEEIEVIRRLNDQASINAPSEGATPKPMLTTATPNCEPAQDAEQSMPSQQFPRYDAPSEDPSLQHALSRRFQPSHMITRAPCEDSSLQHALTREPWPRMAFQTSNEDPSLQHALSRGFQPWTCMIPQTTSEDPSLQHALSRRFQPSHMITRAPCEDSSLQHALTREPWPRMAFQTSSEDPSLQHALSRGFQPWTCPQTAGEDPSLRHALSRQSMIFRTSGEDSSIQQGTLRENFPHLTRDSTFNVNPSLEHTIFQGEWEKFQSPATNVPFSLPNEDASFVLFSGQQLSTPFTPLADSSLEQVLQHVQAFQ